MTAKKEHLPDLIIIGAQKCGTTSLHHYLSLHPEILMTHKKELRFFVDGLNWHKGVKWYKSHFTGEAKIYGESSPVYTNYPESDKVPERIFALVPTVKLIYIVRDPIERIISQYIHRIENGRESKTLAEALVNPRKNQYILRSMYYLQIKQYLHYFDPSSLLVLTTENLYKNPRETMSRVFQFLGVDAGFHSPKFVQKRHTSNKKKGKTATGHFLEQKILAKTLDRLLPPDISYRIDINYHIKRLLLYPFSFKVERPKIDDDLRAILTECLQDDVNQLRKYTGETFADWRI